MKKTIILTLFAFFLLGMQMQAQKPKEESLKQKIIEEIYIPNAKYEKFWVVLDRNYITYQPDEKWEVVQDSMAYVFGNDSCPIRNKLGLINGMLSYKDWNCQVAIKTVFNPMDGRKLPVPYTYEDAKEYIFSHVSYLFNIGRPLRSRSKQERKDTEMLVTYYPADTAKAIFNGVSMFVFPLDFKGESCQGKYRYGRGVVVLGKYNVPLFLFFFMTAESIADFDTYLSELKGLFTFQDIDITN